MANHKKGSKKKLAEAIAIPLAVGGLSGLVTGGSMKIYSSLNQPPFSPPPLVFPIAWTTLYTLMGISSYLVATANRPAAERRQALALYGAQLAVNFFWPILFFKKKAFLISFVWLLFLWGLIAWMTLVFRKSSKTAAWLQVPYLVWTAFAAYLNLGILLLN